MIKTIRLNYKLCTSSDIIGFIIFPYLLYYYQYVFIQNHEIKMEYVQDNTFSAPVITNLVQLKSFGDLLLEYKITYKQNMETIRAW